jgi:hypothetical protein
MRVRISGALSMELAGDIMGLQEKNGYLIISMRTNVGTMRAGSVKAVFTHKDLMDVIKLLLKPSNLRYVLRHVFFGFGKPTASDASPFE